MSRERGSPPPEAGSFEAGIGKVEEALRSPYEKEKERKRLADAFEAIGKAGEVQGALDGLARLADDHESLQLWANEVLARIEEIAGQYPESDTVPKRPWDFSHPPLRSDRGKLDDRIEDIVSAVGQIESGIRDNKDRLHDGVEAGDAILATLDRFRNAGHRWGEVVNYFQRQGSRLAYASLGRHKSSRGEYADALQTLRTGQKTIVGLTPDAPGFQYADQMLRLRSDAITLIAVEIHVDEASVKRALRESNLDQALDEKHAVAKHALANFFSALHRPLQFSSDLISSLNAVARFDKELAEFFKTGKIPKGAERAR